MNSKFAKVAASGLALGLLMGIAATPSYAIPPTNDDSGQHRGNRGENNGGNRGGGEGGNRGGGDRGNAQPRPAPAQPAPAIQPRASGGDRGGRGGNDGQPRGSQGGGRDWNRGNDGQPGGGRDPNRDNNGQPGGGRDWNRGNDGQPNGGRDNAGHWTGGNRPGQQGGNGGRDPNNNGGDRGSNGGDRGGRDHNDRNNGGWNGGNGNGGWNGNRDRDRDRGNNGRNWDRGHGNYHFDYRSDRRFRGYTGLRMGFYFAPTYGYYRVPSQWYGHRWGMGEYLPDYFFRYRIYDYMSYGLPRPPYDCGYFFVGQDVVLVDMSTGEIVDVFYDVY